MCGFQVNKFFVYFVFIIVLYAKRGSLARRYTT